MNQRKQSSLTLAFISCVQAQGAVVSGLIVDEMNPLDNIYSIDLDRDGSEDYRILAGQIFSSRPVATIASYANRPIGVATGAWPKFLEVVRE